MNTPADHISYLMDHAAAMLEDVRDLINDPAHQKEGAEAFICEFHCRQNGCAIIDNDGNIHAYRVVIEKVY